MHKLQRTTIEQRSESKRQQNEPLKLLAFVLGNVAGDRAVLSCGAQASRLSPMQVGTTAAATGFEQARRAAIHQPSGKVITVNSYYENLLRLL